MCAMRCLPLALVLCIGVALCQPPAGVAWRKYPNAQLAGEVLVRDFTQLCAASDVCVGYDSSQPVTSEARCADLCSAAPDANGYVFCNNAKGCGSGCLKWKATYPNSGFKPGNYPVKQFGVYVPLFPSVDPPARHGCQGVLSARELDQWPYRMCSCVRVANPVAPTFAPVDLPPAGAWQCLKGLPAPFSNTPVQWTGAQPQCASFDGKSCYKPSSCNSTVLADIQKRGIVQPLTCGPQHQSVWKTTGYEQSTTWCSKARKFFVPTAASPLPPAGQWQCVPGLPSGFANTPIRWVGLHPQCASYDGKTCWKPPSCRQALTQLQGTLSPLTCGPYHQSAWNITGYEKNTTWCSVARKAYTSNSGWQSGTFVFPTGTCANVTSAVAASTCAAAPLAQRASFATCSRAATVVDGKFWEMMHKNDILMQRGGFRQDACRTCSQWSATTPTAQFGRCWKCAANATCYRCLAGVRLEPDDVDFVNIDISPAGQAQQKQCVECVSAGTQFDSCLLCTKSSNPAACGACALVTDKCPNCPTEGTPFQCNAVYATAGPYPYYVNDHACTLCVNNGNTTPCTTCKFNF